MQLTTHLLFVAVIACAFAAEDTQIQPTKLNSEKQQPISPTTSVAVAADDVPAEASSQSEVVVASPLSDTQPIQQIHLKSFMPAADDPAAFSTDAQRIKRASYVSRNGQQYRIQVVKKPSRSGKINTIHIYPVNKKTHKKNGPEEHRHEPQHIKHHHHEDRPSTDDQREEHEELQPSESDGGEQHHSVYSTEEDRKTLENRARRKLEKMLEVNTGRYDSVGSAELVGAEASQYDEHHYDHKKEKKIKVKHHHHHHHHNHVKTVIKKEPYPVEKIVEKIVHVPKPYPVEKIVEKVVHVPVEKIVNKPYPVEKIVEKIVHVPKPYPVEKVVEKIVHVPKPYPVEKIVEKIVHVPVEKIVKVPEPYPVKEIVEKKVPYPVEKIIHVPKPYPVEKIVEKIVHVPKPYPVYKNIHVPVEVKVPVPYPKPVPYPVEKKVPYPVEVKVEVEKKVPYPIKVYVPYEKKKKNEHSNSDHQMDEEEHEHCHHFSESSYHDEGSPSIERQSVTYAPTFQALTKAKVSVSQPQQSQQTIHNKFGDKLLFNLNPKFASIQHNQQHAINTLKRNLLTNEQIRVNSQSSSPLAKVKALPVEQQQMSQWHQQQEQNRQYQQQLQQFQQQQLLRQQTQIQQQQQQLQQQKQHQIQQQQQNQHPRQQQVQVHQPQQRQPQHNQQQNHQKQQYQQQQPQQQGASSNIQSMSVTAPADYSAFTQTQIWPHQSQQQPFANSQQAIADASLAASNVQQHIVEAPQPAQPDTFQAQQHAISHQYQSFGSDLSGASSDTQLVAILATPFQQQQHQLSTGLEQPAQHEQQFHTFDGDLSGSASSNDMVSIIAPPDSSGSATSFQIDVPEQSEAEPLPEAAALSNDAQSINNFQYNDYTEQLGPVQFLDQDPAASQGFGYSAV